MRRSLAVVVLAIGCAPVERTEPVTPAAMVGVPPPVVTAAPTQTTPARDDSPPAPMGTHTRVIAEPEVAAPQATGPWPRPAYSGRPLDLDVKDADIHNVLRLIADVGRVNIVVTDDVQGSVTVRMRGVPWDQALDVICRSKGLFVERDGNVIIVSSRSR